MMRLGEDVRIEVWAPAKLNLFLEVLGRRPDGFHELETVMTAISLYDTISFRLSNNNSIQLNVHWTWGQTGRGRNATAAFDVLRGDLPTDDNNLVVRALNLLRSAAGITWGARVGLVKRIPTAAGLGGASSDAAAALWAGNLGWGLNWPQEQLGELAQQLGSDVPFFLRARTAICRGRGERITPLSLQRRWHVVIVRPPVGLATGDVYRQCQVPEPTARSFWSQADATQTASARIADAMFNRLQDAAEKLTPWIDRMRREFQRQQVLGHQLSGSGSCYFGLCHNHRHAQHVARRLASRGWWAVFPAVTDCAVRTRIVEPGRN